MLQIDLRGCGDSSGDLGDATWPDWIDDVVRAAHWLRARYTAPLWHWGLRSGCPEFKLWWGEGRYRRVEFYRETMEWHTRWMESQRTLFHATAYRWAWLRRFHARLAAARKRQQSQQSGNRFSPILPQS